MSGIEFVPADFNLSRGLNCNISEAGEVDNVASPVKRLQGGMFDSTFSKVMLLASVVLTVILVYMYVYKKQKSNETPTIEANTAHSEVLQQTSKEDLERMLEEPSTTPTLVNNMSEQMKKT